MRSHPRAVAADWDDLCRIPASLAAVEADVKLGPAQTHAHRMPNGHLRCVPFLDEVHQPGDMCLCETASGTCGPESSVTLPSPPFLSMQGLPQRGAPAPVGYRVCWCIAIPAIVLFDEHLPCASEGHKTRYRLLHMSNSWALRIYSVGLLWYGKRTTKPVSHML